MTSFHESVKFSDESVEQVGPVVLMLRPPQPKVHFDDIKCFEEVGPQNKLAMTINKSTDMRKAIACASASKHLVKARRINASETKSGLTPAFPPR